MPHRRVLPKWLEPSDFHQASGYWASERAAGAYRVDLLVKRPFAAKHDLRDRMMVITISHNEPEGMALDPRRDEDDGA